MSTSGGYACISFRNLSRCLTSRLSHTGGAVYLWMKPSLGWHLLLQARQVHAPFRQELFSSSGHQLFFSRAELNKVWGL